MRFKNFLCAVLIFFAGFSSLIYASNWQQLTVTDLTAAQHYLTVDSAGGADQANPAFQNWLEHGYTHALQLAKQVNSAATYVLVMNYYLNGFHDEHVQFMPFLARFNFNAVWPGFTVYYQDNKFYLSAVGRTATEKSLPPINAELISCDKQPIKKLMLAHIFPYYGDASLDASWHLNTPRLFFYSTNPWWPRWQACQFLVKSQQLTVKLHWQSIDSAMAGTLIKTASYSYQPKTNYHTFGTDGLWIALPNFMPQTSSAAQAIEKLDQLALNWRDKKILVIDIRGNLGGNSAWGSQFLRALYGSVYYEQQTYSRQFAVYQWRVSKNNIDSLSGFYRDYIRKNFGSNSEEYKNLQALITDLQQAWQNKQTYFPAQVTPPPITKPSTTIANPVQAKIYLLTDGRCASSCLTFADELFAFPNVTLIGQPTHADTYYTELRLVKLPSGAHLYYPMKVQRYRQRPSNQPYIPSAENYYHGDINDTKKVTEWLLAKQA